MTDEERYARQTEIDAHSQLAGLHMAEVLRSLDMARSHYVAAGDHDRAKLADALATVTRTEMGR